MAMDKGRFLQWRRRKVACVCFLLSLPVNPRGSGTLELVPLWVLDFLRDKVQRIPARVGVQSRVQRQRHVARVEIGAFE